VSDANVVKLVQPGSFADPLTEVLRNGARALLAQAVEAEVADFLAKHVDVKTATGLRRVVRHGHLPEREVMTGIGPVGVRQPRVRDRGAADDAGRIRLVHPRAIRGVSDNSDPFRCRNRTLSPKEFLRAQTPRRVNHCDRELACAARASNRARASRRTHSSSRDDASSCRP
jgi:hypothetical protein